jgi:hypothetical protein
MAPPAGFGELLPNIPFIWYLSHLSLTLEAPPNMLDPIPRYPAVMSHPASALYSPACAP